VSPSVTYQTPDKLEPHLLKLEWLFPNRVVAPVAAPSNGALPHVHFIGCNRRDRRQHAPLLAARPLSGELWVV
jgi:hypothetical protein